MFLDSLSYCADLCVCCVALASLSGSSRTPFVDLSGPCLDSEFISVREFKLILESLGYLVDLGFLKFDLCEFKRLLKDPLVVLLAVSLVFVF